MFSYMRKRKNNNKNKIKTRLKYKILIKTSTMNSTGVSRKWGKKSFTFLKLIFDFYEVIRTQLLNLIRISEENT